jgi:hypothetical protein
MKTVSALGVMAILLAVMVGCGSDTTSRETKIKVTGTSDLSSTAPKLPEGLVLTAAPAGAKDVGATKKEAKDGETVVIRGRVGGRESDVFTPGYASFYLGDMKLTPCNEKPGDACKTPWDFCCDDSDVITANLVNVEARGADGKPLKIDLKGVQGIDLLSILVVKGKAVKKENDPNVTIIAEGIYVEKGPPKL